MSFLTNFMWIVGLIGIIIAIFFNHIFEGNDFLKIAVPIISVFFIIVGIWVLANNARNKNKVD